jgi:hypothetical protein
MLTILLTTILSIGVVEAAQNCPAGTVRELNGHRLTVVHSGNRIDVTGSPEWGACVPSQH